MTIEKPQQQMQSPQAVPPVLAPPPMPAQPVRTSPVDLEAAPPLATMSPIRTRNYAANVGTMPAWLYEERPAMPTAMLVELILADPTVIMAMTAFKGPMSRATFLGEGSNAAAVQYAQKQMELLWLHREKILRCIDWGWSAAEVLYQSDSNNPGGWSISGLKEFYPYDAAPVTQGGRFVGVDITGGGQFGMSGSDQPPTLPGVTGLWVTHEARFGEWFGRPRPLKAWKPWYALNLRGKGLYSSRRLAAFKYGFRGETAHVPRINETNQLGGNDGRTNGDVALELLESAANGSCRVFGAGPDGKRWIDIEKPDVMPTPEIINSAIEADEKLIHLSVGVPPETISAPGGALGNGGRDIPMQVLYGGINAVLQDVVSQLVERLILPLTALHFGETDTTVRVEPLEVPSDKDEKGEEGGPAGMVGPDGKPVVGGGQVPPVPPTPGVPTPPVPGQPQPAQPVQPPVQAIKVAGRGDFADKLAERGQASLSLSGYRRDFYNGKITRDAAVKGLAFELSLSEKRAAELLPVGEFDLESVQGRFIWRNIGAKDGEGGRKVKLDSETGEIVGGNLPKEMQGTKIGDFGKNIEKVKPKASEKKPAESKADNAKPASTSSSVANLPPDWKLPEHLASVAKKLPKAARGHFAEYSDAIGFDMNSALRNGDDLNDTERPIAKTISATIAKHGKLDKPITSYRGMSFRHPEDYKAFMDKLEGSGTFQSKGFWSTSMDPHLAAEFATDRPGGQVVFEITANRGVYMDGDMTKHPEQKEFLLDHNSQFKVVGTEEKDFGGKKIRVVRLEQAA